MAKLLMYKTATGAISTNLTTSPPESVRQVEVVAASADVVITVDRGTFEALKTAAFESPVWTINGPDTVYAEFTWNGKTKFACEITLDAAIADGLDVHFPATV